MDRSLQVDTRQGAQSPGHIYRRDDTSTTDVPSKLDYYNGRPAGTRPLSLDAASSILPHSNRVAVDARAWLHRSPAVPLKGGTRSQDNLRVRHEIDTYSKDASGPKVNEQSDIPRQDEFHYTRPLMNAQHMPRLEDTGRRRSHSTGLGSRGSKIAALSVQLRTRLSYAAARIEKKRQSQSPYQSPTGLLHRNSSTPILSVETLSQSGQSLIGDFRDQLEDSPDGTTVSAPDAPAASSFYRLDAPIRQALNITSDIYPQPQQDPQKSVERSSERQPPPKLAPPPDIDSGRVNGQRRRPNSNIPGNSLRYAPFPLHKRSRSQQEFLIGSEVTRVPETPPLRPSGYNSVGPFSGLSENLQSSSMEQDAIETLLFMSSPGTSGYYSNSQNSQRNQDVKNVDDSASQGVRWHESVVDNQSSSRQPAVSHNKETRAGDEIDLILDQMDSDSEDDANYTSSRRTRVEARPSTIGGVGSARRDT
ncbi:uncharacterized protein DSM5745_02063 [Aspergillus mulundensis]|uniref:Uncharacterized protein n=1 Tax=Aspergillus mulundensis TaxID=1810919 RepID=A0A3D8SWY4_9EURO|nr:Uncharacterized protein DSM5745_02063 [Aspergillus mulundensis]RDW90288.1 Uncharacterized protein DSM5745_02063 [Aspergillus mulundensis]